MSQPEVSAQPTLDVRGLCTSFHTRAGVLPAVRDVSLSVQPGRILGLVGESGSGKSVTGFSILGLVDEPGRISGGQVLFKGRDLTKLPASQLRGIQGNRVAMIFQDPMMTLNPVLRVDTQMIEAVRAHSPLDRREAREHASRTLALMGIASPEERLRAYPHQLSGGMRQRVAIAIALLHAPDLIIADEPTTALDVTIQAQILSEVQKLVREQGTSLIWITHDLSVIAGLADDVAVMYAGRIVEQGPVAEVLDRPQHPYTQGLIDSLTTQERKALRLKVQMIFQDPSSSLNPRLRVDRIVGEGALLHGLTDRKGADDYVSAQLQRAGLSPQLRQRYPHQFSGGQRQRIGIARALAVQPELLVCDESVAALDVSIQAQILNLFMDLRDELGLTYLFISHDLGVVEHLCDRVVVMYLGRVVETASVDDLFARANHPYTQALLAQIPRFDIRSTRYDAIQGEIPSPLNPPTGCHFHPRCPHAMARCREEVPALREVSPNHQSACHLNDQR
ncbi:Peptide ABC transporter, ATP-binding protein [Pseudomonas amygdali pv. morsprunorum]|uniref:dipeptide ABC transporter ATP-binding protein n=1 Tax=Pseudomonas amygdali TaxID=47877 RepID=UPI000F002007|nr:ABC transporter ATP-binding protein [Pseudomonas amygdali]RMO99250.1 Peptide ABC transporter, ATP-binding protein [Pseudomonas amygdali pv. morsprunorum]